MRNKILARISICNVTSLIMDCLGGISELVLHSFSDLISLKFLKSPLHGQGVRVEGCDECIFIFNIQI